MRLLISWNCLHAQRTEMVERQAPPHSSPPHRLPSVVKWRARWPAVALSGSHSAENRGRTCWQVLRAGGGVLSDPTCQHTQTFMQVGCIVQDHRRWTLSVVSFALWEEIEDKRIQNKHAGKTAPVWAKRTALLILPRFFALCTHFLSQRSR